MHSPKEPCPRAAESRVPQAQLNSCRCLALMPLPVADQFDGEMLATIDKARLYPFERAGNFDAIVAFHE